MSEKIESNRLTEILAKYGCCADPVAVTHSFVKEFLNPKPDDYYWTYRYEHSLRVALWGKRIAEGEGWDSEPLVMACLLHDAGYPECNTLEDFDNHAVISAEVAAKFLAKIQYDEALSKMICKAVAIHDRWNDVPEDAGAFELSVRDADDLDRFDVMRLCLAGRNDIGEHSAKELVKICDMRLSTLEDWKNRVCGTEMAQKFWEEELQMRVQFYESLKGQMQGTLDMEKYFAATD